MPNYSPTEQRRRDEVSKIVEALNCLQKFDWWKIAAKLKKHYGEIAPVLFAIAKLQDLPYLRERLILRTQKNKINEIYAIINCVIVNSYGEYSEQEGQRRKKEEAEFADGLNLSIGQTVKSEDRIRLEKRLETLQVEKEQYLERGDFHALKGVKRDIERVERFLRNENEWR